MNEEVRDGEPAIPANIGWQQMQGMLDQHLPSKKQFIAKKHVTYISIAAILLAIFLFSSLPLDNIFLPSSIAENVLAASLEHKKTGVDPSLSVNDRNSIINLRQLPINGIAHKKINPTFSFNEPPGLPIDKPEIVRSLVSLSQEPGNSREKIFNGVIEKSPWQKTVVPGILPNNPTPAFPYHSKKVNIIPRAKWSLSAGLGINTAVKGRLNLQPYPVSEVKFNISPRFFIAAGVSAWSLVSAKTAGISKTVYLNDTANNMHLYNEITTFKRLHYADVPISFGVNITKNISLQSGLQMSALLNKKTTRRLEHFDYQMNRINEPLYLPVSGFAASSQQEYKVELRKTDYRFIAGIRYTVNKTSVGLMYQRALHTTGKGNNTTATKNQIVSVNLLFQIK